LLSFSLAGSLKIKTIRQTQAIPTASSLEILRKTLKIQLKDIATIDPTTDTIVTDGLFNMYPIIGR